MALISDENHIFVLNPKTGCTSTAKALRRASRTRWVPAQDMVNRNGKIIVPKKHTTIPQLRARSLVPDLDRYVKFTTVRNPFDSFVSAWAKKVGDYAALLDDPEAWVHKHKGYAEGLRSAQGQVSRNGSRQASATETPPV